MLLLTLLANGIYRHDNTVIQNLKDLKNF